MFIYNIFGRRIGMKREGARWLVFRVDLTEHKFSQPYDIITPDEMSEEVVPGWLDDLFHEVATARYSDVRRVE